jgi:hypothetical protein
MSADTGTPDEPCPHLNFAANIDVNRIGEADTDDGRPRAYSADIRVQCAPPPDGCGEPFRFTGLPAGLSGAHPTVNPNETELRAPIRPASADPDFGLGIPGFAIQQVVR